MLLLQRKKETSDLIQLVTVPCPRCAADPACRDRQHCVGGDITLCAVMWQGAHPSQPAAGGVEGTQPTCIPPGWRDRQTAGSAQSLAPAGSPAGHQPQHGISVARQGGLWWVLGAQGQPGEGSLVSVFLQACDKMMPKQHVALDCPARYSRRAGAAGPFH